MRIAATRPLQRVCRGIDLAEIWDRQFWPKRGEVRAADGTVLRTWRDLERWLASEFYRRFSSARNH